ncbi:hypothetical protein [Flavobacterium sp.]|uniref:hypothetical protein n=1 Tax=Flavobacterium sp. TaxID=239 RepID=UPI00391C9FE2
MKNNYTSLKAFSVMEAVFSMVITAIVIGLVFVVFSILSERMMDFKNQNQFVADMNRLTYVINKDIFENEKMNVSDEEIIFSSYQGDVIRYHYNEELTIRIKADFIDTFKIPLRNLIIDTIKNKNERVVYQRLKLNIEVNKQPMKLNFFKKVYPNQLIEAEK